MTGREENWRHTEDREVEEEEKWQRRRFTIQTARAWLMRGH